MSLEQHKKQETSELRAEGKISKDALLQEKTENTWNPVIATWVEVSKNKRISINFDFGNKYANYNLSYVVWPKGEVGVSIFGYATYPEVRSKKTDKTLIYKNKTEAKEKLYKDINTTIGTVLMWEKWLVDALPETEEKIQKKMNLAANWIVYEVNKKLDITQEWKNMIIRTNDYKKITIETKEGFFGKTYLLVLSDNKKIELDDTKALIFANSILKNLPATIKKDQDTLYPKLMKAYQLLKE